MLRPVTYIPDPFRPYSRREFYVEAGEGDTIRSAVPDLCGPDKVYLIHGRRCTDPDTPLLPTDHLAVLTQPQGEFLVGALVSLLISTALTVVARLLLTEPDPEQQRDDESSPTYGFQGIANNRTAGLPIAVTYGRMRMGGQVINEFVEVVGLGASTNLFQLFSFGEGRYQSVGGATVDTPPSEPLVGTALPDGVKIDGNSAENYDDVEIHVRMGTNQQTVIPGFEQAKTPRVVDQELTQEESGALANDVFLIALGGGQEFDATNDPIWDDHAVGFDMNAQDIDGFEVRFNFPVGYFSSDPTTGLLAISWFAYQIRYIELDGVGAPITTGGPAGDGFVRLVPSELIAFARRGSFDLQVRGTFLDPQTVTTTPAAGEAMEANGTTGRATATALPFFPFAVETWNDVSFSVWIRPTGLPAPTAANEGTIKIVFSNTTSVLHANGYGLALEVVRFGTFGNPTYVWAPVILHGTLTALTIERPQLNGPPSVSIQNDSWYHLAGRHLQNFSGNNEQHALWINANLLFANGLTHSPIFGGGTIQFFNHSTYNTSEFLGGRIDSLHFWNRGINEVDIQRVYNAGFGFEGIDPAVVGTGLVSHWAFNSGAGTLQAVTPAWWGGIVLAGGATAGTAAGRVLDSPNIVGTPKRSNYRIQVLRTNRVSTHPQNTNTADFLEVAEVIDAPFVYPNEALGALKITANEQLNNTIPTVTWLIDALLVPVWDGVSTLVPAISIEFSKNPAWIALDIVTNRRYGLGQHFKIPANVDLVSFKDWADYCDEWLYDGLDQPTIATGDDVEFIMGTVDPTTGVTRGTLVLHLTKDNHAALPEKWAAGQRVKLRGFPDETDPGLDNDINNATGIGTDTPGTAYEIKAITEVAAPERFEVELWWDRLDETDPWLTATFITTHATGTIIGAVAERGHRRFEFNGTFDKATNAWDALIGVCAVGRAVPIREGSLMRVKHSRPRSPIAVIGPGSILPDSFEIGYGENQTNENAFDVSYLDEDREYERESVTAVHSSVQNPDDFEKLRRGGTFVVGITNRAQAQRHGNFIVNVNVQVIRQGGFSTAANAMQLEPGDVVRVAHDLVKRGKSGRALQDSGQLDRFVIDRELTIESDKTYNVYFQHANDVLTTSQIDLAQTPPGTYSVGATIFLATPLGQNVRQYDVWIVVAAGDELLVEIATAQTNQDLTRDFRFVEYVEAIYTDWSVTDPLDPLEDDPTPGPLEIPDNVDLIDVDDRAVRHASGVYQTLLGVSWQVNARTRGALSGTNVYYRVIESRDAGITDDEVYPFVTREPWRLAHHVPAEETYAEVPVPESVDGQLVEIAVQPVSTTGKRHRPEMCTRLQHEVSGFGPYPAVLTSPRAVLQGEKALYAWTTAAGDRGDTVEVRRTLDTLVAGWILAPVVLESRPGAQASGAIRDWAGRNTGSPATELWFRARNEMGQFSSDLAKLAFNPAPATVDDFGLTRVSGTDWSTGSPASDWLDPPFTGGEAEATDLVEAGTVPDNYMEFSGSALTATYRTSIVIEDKVESDTTIDESRKPLNQYVEVVLEAEQIHPLTWGEAGFEWGGANGRRWSWEGPVHLRKSEAGLQCTMKVEMRLNIDGTTAGWGPYQDYRPGVYGLVDFQIQLTVTRPNTDFQVRIHELSTRVLQPALKLQERTPYQAAFESEVF